MSRRTFIKCYPFNLRSAAWIGLRWTIMHGLIVTVCKVIDGGVISWSEGGSTDRAPGGALSITGVGMGAVLWWRVLDEVQPKTEWQRQGSLPGPSQGSREAARWAGGSIILLQALCWWWLTPSNLCPRWGVGEQKGPRRCFLTRRWRSGGFASSWRQ
jgi:hypothetical protein